MLPSLRSDTAFLILLVCLLFAALIVTSADMPAAPVAAAPEPRPLPTSTSTPTPGWWAYVPTATPILPGLPALPALSLGGGGRNGTADGPVAFEVLSCRGGGTSIQAITRYGVWWAISGVAQTDPFWYWKMELSPDGEGVALSQSKGWTVLYRSEAPTGGGHLMDFNTTPCRGAATGCGSPSSSGMGTMRSRVLWRQPHSGQRSGFSYRLSALSY